MGEAQVDFETESPRVARVLCGVGVTDEQLRGNAAAVRAGSAKRATFDKGNVHAGGTAVDGGRDRISAAEDNEIVMLGIHAKTGRSGTGCLQVNRVGIRLDFGDTLD